jgi:hypothetical protein
MEGYPLTTSYRIISINFGTNILPMNKFLVSILFLLSVLTASSQRVYFIYLQSEKEQPFFVKMNERIYSSTGSGYLILSKLRDSSYNFSIGFPQSQLTEMQFSVTINKKDHGYLIKDFGDKGWGLFDLQTLSVQMSMSNKRDAALNTPSKDVSAFSDILSKVADDPTLRERSIPAKQEDKNTIAPQQAVKKEEVKTIPVETSVVKQDEKKEDAKENPAAVPQQKTEQVPVYKPSVVTAASKNTTPEGQVLTYIDDYQNGNRDTINILIPKTIEAPEPVKEQPKEEKKFLDITTDSVAQKVESTPVAEIKNNVTTTVEPTTMCKEAASESDFLKLRKKMAAQNSDDAMVSEAKKSFRLKCFTITQIKNLSSLFLSDGSKYQFFDAIYDYVKDTKRFVSLQSELKDDYYINRFKAMLRN